MVTDLDISRGGEQPLYADWLALLRDAGWTYQTTIAWLESPTFRARPPSPSAPSLVHVRGSRPRDQRVVLLGAGSAGRRTTC